MGTVKFGNRKLTSIDKVDYENGLMLYLYSKDGHCVVESFPGCKLDCRHISANVVSCVNLGVYLKECNIQDIVSKYMYFSSNNECEHACIGNTEFITWNQFCIAKDVITC